MRIIIVTPNLDEVDYKAFRRELNTLIDTFWYGQEVVIGVTRQGLQSEKTGLDEAT